MTVDFSKKLSIKMVYESAYAYLKEFGQINPVLIIRHWHVTFEEAKNVIEHLLENYPEVTRHPDKENFPNSLCLNNKPKVVKEIRIKKKRLDGY